MYRLGYNTNGLAHHRLLDALDLLAQLGYDAVALTLDVGHLDPYHCTAAEVRAVRERLEQHGLGVVVETGARFLMDPSRKHFPTLLEDSAEDRRRRVDFLRRCCDLAVELGASVVSIWSGVAPDGGRAADDPEGRSPVWDRLCGGLEEVLDHARGCSTTIAFEPEPGMFIERPGEYLALADRLGARGDELGLTLDVGHLVCTGDLPVGAALRDLAPRLRNVHLDDCPAGRHQHRFFGEGDLDLEDALTSLIEIGYGGVASVELSRDSHRGAQIAARAIEKLRPARNLNP